jgi:hypothetical protein
MSQIGDMKVVLTLIQPDSDVSRFRALVQILVVSMWEVKML